MVELSQFAEPRNDPAGGDEPRHGATIQRLAAMHPLDYEKARMAEAAGLGCRAGVLDDLVKAERARKNPGTKNGGKPDLCPQPEFWPDPVVPFRLLDEIKATIITYIICDDEVAVAATLWVAFTWFIDVVQVAPLVVITAPEPRCGKTQLLDLLGRCAKRPLVASNISPAAVFRVIERESPTLMIDEADSFLKENEEMRGVINSGHTRQSAYVIRTVGDDHDPQRFSTWGAKALSGIGHLSQTLMDRAITLELRRKLKSEKVQRLRHADPGIFERLASMLATYAEASSAEIQQARPKLPDELNDRAQDNWEPLLSIADHAGGSWPGQARKAALKLAGVGQEPMSLAALLLSDIRDAFGDKEKLQTFMLMKALCTDESKPWHTFDHGRQITASQLARLLKPYGIKPKDLKEGGVTLKGYTLTQFEDVFARYLSNPAGGDSGGQPATSQSNQGDSGCGPETQGATARDPLPFDGCGVAAQEITRNPGATARTAETLNGCGVAGEGGGEYMDDGPSLFPTAAGDGFTVDL